MTKDELEEALQGRLRCVCTQSAKSNLCGDRAAGGRSAGYMAPRKGGICRLMCDVARGTRCTTCAYACGRWVERLLECRDDGEIREVLGKACAGWTPPATTNRIPGEEAEP